MSPNHTARWLVHKALRQVSGSTEQQVADESLYCPLLGEQTLSGPTGSAQIYTTYFYLNVQPCWPPSAGHNIMKHSHWIVLNRTDMRLWMSSNRESSICAISIIATTVLFNDSPQTWWNVCGNSIMTTAEPTRLGVPKFEVAVVGCTHVLSPSVVEADIPHCFTVAWRERDKRETLTHYICTYSSCSVILS